MCGWVVFSWQPVVWQRPRLNPGGCGSSTPSKGLVLKTRLHGVEGCMSLALYKRNSAFFSVPCEVDVGSLGGAISARAEVSAEALVAMSMKDSGDYERDV